METAICKEIDLPYYKNSLVECCKFIDNIKFSAVKTKYNEKLKWDESQPDKTWYGWEAISIKGYSDDVLNILKPGVLKSGVEVQPLRWTYLYEQSEMLPIKEILSHIPAEFDRVRIMRLRAGTSISKHTDKVDKEIKDGKLVRLHVPLRTDKNVHFYLWEDKEEHHFNLEIGKYYYVDVSKPHAVHNKSLSDRLHLVIDCYMNPKLENLLKQAEEFDDISSPIGF